jgi:1-acyl-sn-glycerol-3-phosphate acyltransferase
MKKIVRGFLSAIAFSIFGIGALSLGLTLLPLIAIFVRDPVRRKQLSVAAIKHSWVFFVRIMELLTLIKVNINRDALRNLQGTIIVANHPSLIDVVILVSVLPKPICVVKSAIESNFFMKQVILNTYIANSQDADEFIESCTNVLNEGYNLVIFPEGTRTHPDIEPKLHRGAAYVAMSAKAPIQTMHIAMSDRILGKGQKFYDVADKQITYTIEPRELIMPEFAMDANSTHRANVCLLTKMIQVNIEK